MLAGFSNRLNSRRGLMGTHCFGSSGPSQTYTERYLLFLSEMNEVLPFRRASQDTSLISSSLAELYTVKFRWETWVLLESALYPSRNERTTDFGASNNADGTCFDSSVLPESFSNRTAAGV